jgi:hypothetical protein
MATAAFVSFRESLDTDDVVRWPAASFGAVNDTHGPHAGKRLNQTRMLSIVKANQAYGAEIENVAECASFKSIVQKKGMYLNDVGYRIWPGNYGKFLRQLNATATSVGRWRVGPRDQGYGRFARALEQETGSAAITLSLEPGFAAAHRDASGLLNVSLRVVYLDSPDSRDSLDSRGKEQGNGRWVMSYPAADGKRGTAMSVTRTGSGRWKVAQANVLMAPTDVAVAASAACDFELRSLDVKDEVFSLVEVLVHPALKLADSSG